MYGLVNRAVEGLIRQEFGDEAWGKISSKAGVGALEFVSMQTYDDKVTYDLVGAASEVLGAPAADLMRAFGQYWIRYTADAGYGDLLKGVGGSFGEFLAGLDAMHGRVAMTFPDLKPPSFECEELSPARYRLHYYSDRPGLEPMVVGLVEGLAERFSQAAKVEWSAEGEGHTVFEIEIAPVEGDAADAR